MATVMTTERLGKRYTLGNTTGGYSRLTESVATLVARVFARNADPSVEPSPRELWALRDVTFTVDEGDVLGVIGHNGAGKSTLLKIMSRITDPTEGRAVVRGRVASLLEVGTGFHPELTGRENVFLNGAILGMTRREIKDRLDDIVDFAEVRQFIDTPVKRYSSGMQVRLAFSVAAYLEPEILIVDEVLAVGDLAFQKKCMGRMSEVAESGRTVLFVSHNMGAVQALCSRCLVIDHGRIVADTDPETAIARYVEGVTERGANRVSLERRPGVSVQVVDFWVEADGAQTGEVELGAGLVAVVRFAVEDNPRDVTIALLVSREGTPLLYTYDTDADPAAAAKRRPDGVYEARVVLPFELFKEGVYRLAVQIGHGREDLTDRRAALDVLVTNTRFDTTHHSFRRDRPGHLYTRLDWEVEPLSPHDSMSPEAVA